MGNMTSALLVLEYIGGYFVFGLFYWILNGILMPLKDYSIDADLLAWCNLLWGGAIVLYMLLGAVYLFKAIKEFDIIK